MTYGKRHSVILSYSFIFKDPTLITAYAFMRSFYQCHDTKQNDTPHNDTQRNCTP